MIKWAWIAFLVVVLAGCSNTSDQSTGNHSKKKVEPNSDNAKTELKVEPLVPIRTDGGAPLGAWQVPLVNATKWLKFQRGSLSSGAPPGPTSIAL